MPYPPTFSPPTSAYIQSQTLPLTLNDPFNLSTIPETTHYYDALSTFEGFEPPVEQPILCCSVCGQKNGALALLEPCTHPLCSACLTSALNIVGEKDMECAVCSAKVDDFKLQNFSGIPNNRTSSQPSSDHEDQEMGNGNTSFSFSAGLMDGGFDDFLDRAQGASTPVIRNSRKQSKGGEGVVLRIDNVPWVSAGMKVMSLIFSMTSVGHHSSCHCYVVETPSRKGACPPRSEG